MAKDVTLKVGADASGAKAEIDKLGKKIDDIADIGDKLNDVAGFAALFGAFTKLTGAIATTITDFKEAEQIGNKLNQAMVNQGIYTTTLKQGYDELAGAIQKKTRFGDDDVKAGLAIAQGFLGQIEITDELTQSVADLAEAQGMDLQSAFALVGKSVGGPTNALARYGISIDKTKSKAEQMEEVTRNLNQAFGGQAEAAAKGLGSLDRLGNAFGEISESVGKAFAPALIVAADALADIAFWISENEEITEWVAILLTATTAIVGVTAAVVAVNFALATFGATLAAIALPVTAVVAAVVALGAAWKYNFLGIQEVTFGVWAAIKSLFGNMMEAFGGLGTVMAGLFTGNLDKIKEGLAQFGKAHLDAINNTVKAYEGGRDAKLKAMAEEDKTEADLLAKSAERAKGRKAQVAELTDAQKKAIEEREKAEERAATARFNREEKALEGALENVIDEEDATADSLERIKEDRLEFDAALVQLHALRLKRIDDLKLADIERIEAIKDAEAALDEAKRKFDGDESSRIANLESLRIKKEQDANEAAAKSRAEFIDGLKAAYSGLITAGQDIKNFFSGNFVDTISSFITDFGDIPKSLLTSFQGLGQIIDGVPAKFDETGKVIEEGIAPLAEQITEAAGQLAEQVPKIAESFAKEFPNIINQFVKAMPRVADAIVNSLPKLTAGLAAAAPKIVGAFMDALTSIAHKLPEILGPLFAAIPEIIGKVLEGLPDLIFAILDALPDLIVMLVDAIPAIVEKLADNIGPIVEALVEGLIVAAGEIVIGLVDSLLLEGGLERIVGALLRAIPRIAFGIVEGLVEAGSQLIPAFGALFGRAFDSAIPAIGDAIDSAFMSVGEGLQTFFGDLFSPLNDIANMLSDTPSWVEWLQDIVDDLYGALDSVTGGGGDDGAWYDPRSWSTGTNKAAHYASVGSMFPGTPRATDVIPAWVAPGEAVINSKSVAANPTAVAQLQGAGGPMAGGGDNVIRLIPADALGRAMADWLVQSSALGTGSLRFAVGSES